MPPSPSTPGGREENSPSEGFSRKGVTRDETRVLTVHEPVQDGSNIAHDDEIGSGISQAQGGGPHSAPRTFGVEIQGDGDSAGNSSGLDAGNLDLHLDLETGEARSGNSTLGRTSRNSRGRGGDSWMQVSWLSASSWMAFIMNVVRYYTRLLEPTYLSFRELAVEVGTRSLTIFPADLVFSSPLAPLCAGGIQIALVEKKLALLRLRVLGSDHLGQRKDCLELVLPGVWQKILSVGHFQGLSSGIRNCPKKHVHVFWRGFCLIDILRLPDWA